jgi:hypothetical protein
MKQVLLAAALALAPLAAYAQAPDVASAADAATVQGTRILTMLSGQITDDQTQLKALRAQVADLQAKLTAATKPLEAPSSK